MLLAFVFFSLVLPLLCLFLIRSYVYYIAKTNTRWMTLLYCKCNRIWSGYHKFTYAWTLVLARNVFCLCMWDPCVDLEGVFIIPPILHNLKGAGSRLVSIFGRLLPPQEAHSLLCAVARYSQRHAPPSLPAESKQCMTAVRRRFLGGLSLTGRQCRMLFSDLVGRMLLPCPLHQAALSFCHITWLLYSSTPKLDVPWWTACGHLHVLLNLSSLHCIKNCMIWSKQNLPFWPWLFSFLHASLFFLATLQFHYLLVRALYVLPFSDWFAFLFRWLRKNILYTCTMKPTEGISMLWWSFSKKAPLRRSTCMDWSISLMCHGYLIG